MAYRFVGLCALLFALSPRLTTAPAARVACVKTEDCGSPGLFCEYAKAGCKGVTGVCKEASCMGDPMNRVFCGCDGKTDGTGSMCLPDHPYASLGACGP